MPEVAAMPCQELVELITAYLDSTLDAMDRERLEAHLGLCDACIAYIEQFRETIALTGRLRTDDLPPDTQADLLKVFKDWRAA